MMNFNIDSKIFERFSEVVYALSVIIFLGFVVSALYVIFGNEPSISILFFVVGGVFYGFGWIVRFILTGKSNFLFQGFIISKFKKYIEIIKEKTK